MIFSALIALALCLPPSTVAAPADDTSTSQLKPSATSWPTFRGDSLFSGVAPGKLDKHFTLVWTFETQKAIKSSAAISRGVVYIGSDDGHVYALDLITGEQRWTFRTDGPVEAPPVVVDDRVFVGSSDGLLYAIHAKDGQQIWKHPTDGRIVGSANWHRSDDGQTTSVLVGSYDNSLHCVDAASGVLRWRYETENYVNGAAAIVDGTAVFGGCDGTVYKVAIDSGLRTAQVELGSPIAGTIAVTPQSAYIGHYGNQFVRIDLGEKQVAWIFEDHEFPFFSCAAIGHDRVVFGSRARRVYCVRREDGKQIWSFQTRGNVDSSPVICDDKVVVGSDDGRLYLLRLETGEKIWSYQVGEMITASPAVADGMIIIGAEDGLVYAFGPSAPAPPQEIANGR